MLDALILADRATEDRPLLGVFGRTVECNLAQPHRFGGNQNAFGVQSFDDVLKALALFADSVLDRDLEPLNEELV
jgi:hypothetical protein